MTKEGWQYTAIFLASTLFLSNAAHFYTRRVMQHELANYADAAKSTVSAVDERVAVADPIVEDHAVIEVVGLQPNERCISGQRFRRIPNGWEDFGTC